MTSINTDAKISGLYDSAKSEAEEAKADLTEAKRTGAPQSEIRRLEAKLEKADEVFDDASIIIYDDTLDAQIETLEKGLQELKDEADYVQLLHMSPQEQLDFQRNDPDGFRDAMGKVPAEEKQGLFMGIQNEIQSENRFWSMMTNSQQASHDTQKSILANFRV